MTAGVTVPSPRTFDVVAIGDPVLDVVVHSAGLPSWDDKKLGSHAFQYAGGSEANAACAASRLGLRTALFGSLGSGHEATFLTNELRRFGVAEVFLRQRRGATCATAVIFVSDSGERAITYVPMQDQADRWDELQAMLLLTRCIYTLPYDMDTFQRLAAVASSAGTLVAADVERAVASTPHASATLCSSVDILFFNEAGFFTLTGMPATVTAAAAYIQTSRARVLVVTLGPRGALAVDRCGQSATHRAFHADVVDTTGAGDTFNAAFLAAYLRGHDLLTALAQGCAAACCCVEAPGARAGLPTPDQIDTLQRSRPLSANACP